MEKTITSVLAILVVVLALPPLILGPRIYKDYKKKKAFKDTYAIINMKNGKAIRVRAASNDDRAEIILYSHHNWECMTWQFIQLDGESFLLKNLYTQKTFQPSAAPQAGVSLWQQALGGSRLQYWDFVKQPDDTYLIRLMDTALYLTASGDDNNLPIVLRSPKGTAEQSWKLIRQNPIY